MSNYQKPHFEESVRPVSTEYSYDCNVYRVRFEDGTTREYPGTVKSRAMRVIEHEQFCTGLQPLVSFKYLPKGMDPVVNED